MSLQRLDFEGYYLEVDALPRINEFDGYSFRLAFNSVEDFHDIVKRLAKDQDDKQIMLAHAALENEMGLRSK